VELEATGTDEDQALAAIISILESEDGLGAAKIAGDKCESAG